VKAVVGAVFGTAEGSENPNPIQNLRDRSPSFPPISSL